MASETKTEVVIKPWVKRGTMMVSAYALDISDPEHAYNQVMAQGAEPEDYGLVHPITAEFEGKTRAQLIHEIGELRQQITAMARWM